MVLFSILALNITMVHTISVKYYKFHIGIIQHSWDDTLSKEKTFYLHPERIAAMQMALCFFSAYHTPRHTVITADSGI